jgi:hypothetical protein
VCFRDQSRHRKSLSPGSLTNVAQYATFELSVELREINEIIRPKFVHVARGGLVIPPSAQTAFK